MSNSPEMDRRMAKVFDDFRTRMLATFDQMEAAARDILAGLDEVSCGYCTWDSTRSYVVSRNANCPSHGHVTGSQQDLTEAGRVARPHERKL